MRTAILILTPSGLDLARKVRAALPGDTSIFGPACAFGSLNEPGFEGWHGPLREFLPTIWARHDAILAVMALGIVVRLVAPLASDKRRDPAVLVVDDAGRFAVSVLGGHGSGANDLTRMVARAVEAIPVITTASEARGLPAVDRIGRRRGWRIERAENLTRAAAAVVRRRRVAVFQDAGAPDWWSEFGPWPDHFVRLESISEWARAEPDALLVISDRVEPPGLPADRTIVYRPPTLVAGVGCKRGVVQETITGWIADVLARAGLAIGSLGALATVSLKADEPGLRATAEALGIPLLVYPPEDLAGHPGIERPSARVREKIGIAAVAEPSALRGSGADRLLVAKQVGPGVTVALARRPDHQAEKAPGPKPGA